jgi:hypothetical protein
MTEQEILDNAPEGATHFEGDSAFKYDSKYNEWFLPFHNTGEWSIIPKDYPLSGCKDFRSLSDIKRIAELEAQLKAAQAEWISVEEFKPNGQRMFDVWYGNHRLSGIQLLDGDYWDTVSARYLDSSAITHCIMPPAPPEKGQ